MMYCKRCGKEIHDNSAFCRYCGQKIERGATQIRETKPQGNMIYIVLLVLSVVCFISFIGSCFTLSQESQRIERAKAEIERSPYSDIIKTDPELSEFSDRLRADAESSRDTAGICCVISFLFLIATISAIPIISGLRKKDNFTRNKDSIWSNDKIRR